MTACPDREMALHALIDGELDSANNLAIEAHVRGCAGCTAALEELTAIRTMLQPAALRYRAPSGLRDRVIAQIDSGYDSAPAAASRPLRGSLRPWLGGGALGALAASVALLIVVPQLSTTGLQDQLVASHVRSLQGGHLTDIATSDRHVVKPWFNGRIDFSPPVVELAAQGFPLAGGRLDYVEGRTVASLVYHRRLHTINLFIRPAPKLGLPVTATMRRDSYTLTRWRSGRLEYWAVSDIEPAELDAFRADFRAATGT